MNEERGENFFIELLKIGIPVVMIVLIVRLFVAQPFIVSGSSMDPTFHSGEYLIIDELTYHFEEPRRGDVVIFKYPKDESQYFIKRIIGLPGETLEISNSSIALVQSGNSRVYLKEPYITYPGNGSGMTVSLGPDEYFVMGDNRPDSSDSRLWGDLPRENIIGRAFLRLLPPNELGVFPGKAEIEHTALPVSSASGMMPALSHLSSRITNFNNL